jgi:hypothetical protein
MHILSFFCALVFFSSDLLVFQTSFLAFHLPPVLVKR